MTHYAFEAKKKYLTIFSCPAICVHHDLLSIIYIDISIRYIDIILKTCCTWVLSILDLKKKKEGIVEIQCE